VTVGTSRKRGGETGCTKSLMAAVQLGPWLRALMNDDDNRWDIQFKTDWGTTGRKWNSFALHSMDEQWHVLSIVTYAFYISRTIIRMQLTGQTTDCGNYETYLKL
jgi:hypothetical protein